MVFEMDLLCLWGWPCYEYAMYLLLRGLGRLHSNLPAKERLIYANGRLDEATNLLNEPAASSWRWPCFIVAVARTYSICCPAPRPVARTHPRRGLLLSDDRPCNALGMSTVELNDRGTLMPGYPRWMCDGSTFDARPIRWPTLTEWMVAIRTSGCIVALGCVVIGSQKSMSQGTEHQSQSNIVGPLLLVVVGPAPIMSSIMPILLFRPIDARCCRTMNELMTAQRRSYVICRMSYVI